MSNLRYVKAKIDHMMRIGIPAGFGPHGGAIPDWAKIEQNERVHNAPASEPRKRRLRDITKGNFGLACQNALRQVAAADLSDPFAALRLRTHLQNGIEDDPQTVGKRAEAIVVNRKAAIERGIAERRMELQK